MGMDSNMKNMDFCRMEVFIDRRQVNNLEGVPGNIPCHLNVTCPPIANKISRPENSLLDKGIGASYMLLVF